jgi:hypothetical protein
MESKNIPERKLIDPSGTEEPLTKGIPVYKFAKSSGRNCGQLLPGEQRDHTSYDYSDEM